LAAHAERKSTEIATQANALMTYPQAVVLPEEITTERGGSSKGNVKEKASCKSCCPLPVRLTSFEH
jgi:hypothetical protein